MDVCFLFGSLIRRLGSVLNGVYGDVLGWESWSFLLPCLGFRARCNQKGNGFQMKIWVCL